MMSDVELAAPTRTTSELRLPLAARMKTMTTTTFLGDGEAVQSPPCSRMGDSGLEKA